MSPTMAIGVPKTAVQAMKTTSAIHDWSSLSEWFPCLPSKSMRKCLLIFRSIARSKSSSLSGAALGAIVGAAEAAGATVATGEAAAGALTAPFTGGDAAAGVVALGGEVC